MATKVDVGEAARQRASLPSSARKAGAPNATGGRGRPTGREGRDRWVTRIQRSGIGSMATPPSVQSSTVDAREPRSTGDSKRDMVVPTRADGRVRTGSRGKLGADVRIV